MRMFLDDGTSRRPLSQMSFMQSKQAAAIVDCIGRLYPQEGVDFDVEIVFKGENSPSVSMTIVPLTDKGEWWKRYVAEAIKIYPPSVENVGQPIEEEFKPEPDVSEKKDEVVDAEIVP